MHLKHGYIRFGCTKQLNLLVAFGWVGLGFVQIFSVVMGWVGLVQSADGLGWIGSQMDPWTPTTVTFLLVTATDRLLCAARGACMQPRCGPRRTTEQL